MWTHIAAAGAAIMCAAVLAAPAQADVAGLNPFVGTWDAHEQAVVIAPDGVSHLDYEDFDGCPGCSMADAPRATADFTLTSVSRDTATGNVTARSDPQSGAVGDPVTATLVATPFGDGQLVQLSMGRMQRWNFCNGSSMGDCGA